MSPMGGASSPDSGLAQIPEVGQDSTDGRTRRVRGDAELQLPMQHREVDDDNEYYFTADCSGHSASEADKWAKEFNALVYALSHVE